jgi:hypothetical protein
MKRTEAIQSQPHRAVPRITVMTHTTSPPTGGDDTKEVKPDAAHRIH